MLAHVSLRWPSTAHGLCTWFSILLNIRAGKFSEALTQPSQVCHHLIPPASGGNRRRKHPGDFQYRPPPSALTHTHTVTQVFLTALSPLKSSQVAQLTSPPLAYSITKHRRSWVWKAYFSACEGNRNAGTESHLCQRDSRA